MKISTFIFALLLGTSSSFGNTDSLLQVAKGMRNTDTNLVGIYTKLAWSYLALGDTTKTLFYLKEGKTLSEQLNFDNGITNAYSNIGMYYTRYGLIDSAISYFSLCLKKSKAINDITVSSKTCINIAGAYLGKADYAEAIQYYLEALQYLEKTNDQYKIAINYHCLGIAYYMLKNYPLSLKYYYLSMETGEKIGKPDETGYNYNGIGVVYKEMRELDSALFYLGKANAAAEKNSDKYLLSHNLSDQGEVYYLQGHTNEALTCLSKALTLQRSNSDQRGMAETSILFGNAFLKTNDYLRAKLYFDSARVISVSIGSKDVQKNAWKGLSAVYEDMHNYPASLDAYRHYSDIKDTLYTEESSRQIAEMQTKYNTEKKEKENVLLQNENTIKNLQITKEKNQKNILLVSFGFILVISAIYYNRYRLKQNNKLLVEREMRAHAVFQAQENEKAKLSKELHDGVGALLSLIKLNVSSIQPDAANEKILNSTKTLATDAIREVRGISHDLMPSVLAKAGLEAALVEMAEQVNTSRSIDIQLTYALTERMPPETEGNIFRIIQEATNNIIKHAAATKEVLNIYAKNGQVVLDIYDDGKGFDKNILSKITGNGLNNIYSRVNAMKGEIDITTGEGHGTRINVILPFKKHVNA